MMQGEGSVGVGGVGQAGAKAVVFRRVLTRKGHDPLDLVKWGWRKVELTEKGQLVFSADVEAPLDWDDLAVTIVAAKYMRKRGATKLPGGAETSVRQVLVRIAYALAEQALVQGVFGPPSAGPVADDPRAEMHDIFRDELLAAMLLQMCAFNSPVWFNVGLDRYGVTAKTTNFRWDEASGRAVPAEDAYACPQGSACFIQSIPDSLEGIFGLVQNESRVFRHGSGTGTNFSPLRGRQEKLSGGGNSSGLMSFLDVFDRAAGATKSGGTTRRAAKMVVLDMDHPEIVDFIEWKAREERKMSCLVGGGFTGGIEGEAARTVSGQNSNNSIRVTDDFMSSVDRDGEWETRARTTGKVVDTYRARDLWKKVVVSAWSCADPGVQFDDVIQRWHTCKASGRINASNPCVTGETMVATADGMRRIDSLLATGFQVVGSDGVLHDVAPAFQTGTKPVYRLRTRCGYELRLTADHRVLTANRGDVKACELTRDDRIVLGRPVAGHRSLPAGHAELLGMIAGNGSIDANGTLSLVNPLGDSAATQRAADAVNAIKQSEADERARRPVHVVEVDSVLRFNTSATSVVDLVRSYVVADGGSEKKAFRDEAFRLDATAMASLLRGLFTADGTVANYGDKGRYVSLDSCSLRLLQQTQQMLLVFGVKSKLYRDRRPMGQTMAILPDGQGGMKEYPVQQMHSLRISRSSRVTFQQAVGFSEGSPKAEALTTLNATGGTYADQWTDTLESMAFDGVEPVYDMTEPATDHFVANGVVVHNCSEYFFLDDTACNLASINWEKFLIEESSGRLAFDHELYQHVIDVLFTAQEVLVDYASYPTEAIAANSHAFRPLGIGPASVGAMLMRMGVPYDSDRGRAIAGAICSLMTGRAYRMSALLAAVRGPFPGYAPNAMSMREVMTMHLAAAEALPAGHDDEEVVAAARESWAQALHLGDAHGYRNAQASVAAPTGTISIAMSCGTSGIEPDFGLVRFKTLIGGGMVRIASQAFIQGLRSLGYSADEVRDIEQFVIGTMSLTGLRSLSRDRLSSLGVSDAALDRIEAAFKSVTKIEDAFTPGALGESLAALGLSDKVSEDGRSWRAGFSLFTHWGISREAAAHDGDVALGRRRVEGAPHLRPEHLAAFDCSMGTSRGARTISSEGHVRMLGALQGHLSGGISKTVNLPRDATVEDVDRTYRMAHGLGVKCVALYRDGSKESQPVEMDVGVKGADASVRTALELVLERTEPGAVQLMMEGPAEVLFALNRAARAASGQPVRQPEEYDAAVRTIRAAAPKSGVAIRQRLPARRKGGFTQEARVGGHKVFVRTGEYADGRVGEVFISMHKTGAPFRSMMDCLSIALSIGLQHGVPLSAYVDSLTSSRFAPEGMVTMDSRIRFATSVVDYAMRLLGVEYLKRDDLAHLPASQSYDATAELPAEPVDVGGLSVDVGDVPDHVNDGMLCDNCHGMMVPTGKCWTCRTCFNSSGSCS